MRLPLVISVLSLIACNSTSPPQQDPAKAATPASGAAAEAAAPVLDECPGKSADSCGEAKAASADESHFGDAFSIAESEALSAAAARVSDGKTKVRVTGTVDAVCQKKGCWMVLKDGDTEARVFTHAGGFFLPIQGSKGKHASVEGELEARTVSKEFAKHLAEDSGEDPAAVAGPKRELVMNATVVELTPSSS